ncbi:hypothetical protein [Acidisphaera sp. S103]|uniref:hypothetical protein n=1 Tax=Acidisphaera sp. S103 TaxID=1747223 RepID=UPI00131E5045|nr:hypothetical protein [Acidisphaera sp. S103]
MLRLLDSGINPTAIKGIQRHYRLPDFKHGEMTRLCVRALRRAEAPVSAGVVAQEIAKAKGIEVTASVLSRVRLTMIRLTREGRVIRSGAHRARLWMLRQDG